MNQTTLQIPIDKRLRDKARKAARGQGFSSLQEIVRVFLSQMAEKGLQIGFVSEGILLSNTNEKRYLTMLDDKETGALLETADEVMDELRT